VQMHTASPDKWQEGTASWPLAQGKLFVQWHSHRPLAVSSCAASFCCMHKIEGPFATDPHVLCYCRVITLDKQESLSLFQHLRGDALHCAVRSHERVCLGWLCCTAVMC